MPNPTGSLADLAIASLTDNNGNVIAVALKMIAYAENRAGGSTLTLMDGKVLKLNSTPANIITEVDRLFTEWLAAFPA